MLALLSEYEHEKKAIIMCNLKAMQFFPCNQNYYHRRLQTHTHELIKIHFRRWGEGVTISNLMYIILTIGPAR